MCNRRENKKMSKEATKGDEIHSSMPLSWPCGIPFRHDAVIVYQNMQLIPTYTPLSGEIAG